LHVEVRYLLASAVLLPAQRDQPVFRAGSKLIELTVTVRNKSGQAVPNFGISDFTVEDNGRKRVLAFSRFGGEVRPHPAEMGLAPGVFTNRPEAAAAVRRYRAPSPGIPLRDCPAVARRVERRDVEGSVVKPAGSWLIPLRATRARDASGRDRAQGINRSSSKPS
jgi:hypothetical protein